MAKITFVPWYVADWLADTADLDPVEYWLYHRFLMQIYKESTFVDRSYIERITRTLRDDDKPKVDFILRTFFYEVREGERVGYMNKRALATIEKIAEKSEKARKSVMKRYVNSVDPQKNERTTNVEGTNHKGTTIKSQINNIYTPISPTQERAKEAPKKARRKTADSVPDAQKPDEVTQESWDAWMQIRKDKNAKHFSARALTLLRSECAKANITLQNAIDTCISRNWASFRVEYGNGSKSAKFEPFGAEEKNNPFIVKRPEPVDEDEEDVLALLRG